MITKKSPRELIAAALVSLLVAAPLAAGPRGGGGARTSVNRGGGVNRNENVNRNTNINRNTNVNVNRDVNVNVHGGYGYGYGGCCYHPVATAAAVTAAAVVTTAVVGSIVAAASMPTGCVTTVVGGVAYQQCGSTWYQPQYAGTTVNYVVVAHP